MELDVTTLVKPWENPDDTGEYPQEFSDSIANSGMQNIGQITWDNAREYAEENPIAKLPSEFEELREWLGDFGAWDEQEINDFTEIELNALLVQFIAGDYQESQAYDSFEEYSENAGGRLYPSENKWFFYVGS